MLNFCHRKNYATNFVSHFTCSPAPCQHSHNYSYSDSYSANV
jgi:hypothetical protein